MEAVESCGHEERGAVNPVGDGKWGFVVLEGLEESEVKAQEDRKGEGLNRLFSFAFYDAVVGSGDCDPGRQ